MKTFLKRDIMTQRMILKGIGICLIGMFFTGALSLILAFFILQVLMIWQLVSGFVLGCRGDDNIRKNYFLLNASYLFCIIYSLVGPIHFASEIYEIFIIYSPVATMVIWYYSYSKKDLEKNIIKPPKALENILDSEEIFKPIL